MEGFKLIWADGREYTLSILTASGEGQPSFQNLDDTDLGGKYCCLKIYVASTGRMYFCKKYANLGKC